ncbi:cupin domain-containing protein [Micromonospora rosaria]|uniref:cupin domain-containing protein n=1 Tax=Micromonospora rosaria TaxID=47874 RepID=UPI0037CC77EF
MYRVLLSGLKPTDVRLTGTVGVATSVTRAGWSRSRPDRDETEMLCGKYRLDCSRRHPLMAELPEVVHLPSRVGSHLELRAAIDLLAGDLDERRPGSCIALPSLLDLLLVYMIRSWMTETVSGVWPGALGDPVTAPPCGRCTHTRPPRGASTSWPPRRASPDPPWRAGSPPWSAARRWRISRGGA